MLFYDEHNMTGRKIPSGLLFIQPLGLLVIGFLSLAVLAKFGYTVPTNIHSGTSFELAARDGITGLAMIAPEENRSVQQTALFNLLTNDPDKLKLLLPADIKTLFDEPELRRQEEKAEMWQYRSTQCVLTIYMNATASGGQSVEHFTMRTRRSGTEPAQKALSQDQCIKSIIQDYTLPKRKKKFA